MNKVIYPIVSAFLLVLSWACESSLSVTPTKLADAAKALRVDYVEPEVLRAGANLYVIGAGLNADLKLELGGQALTFEVVSANEIKALIPSDFEVGQSSLKIIPADEDNAVSQPLLILSADAAAYSAVDAAAICKGTHFISNSGLSLEGQKNCDSATVPGPTVCDADHSEDCVTTADYPALAKAELKDGASYLSSLSIAGQKGAIADCSANGDACFLPAYSVISQNLKALDPSTLDAAKIKIGSSIAGITGTLAAAPASCSSDGQSACTTDSNYPSVDKNNIAASLNKMRSSLTVASLSGSIADCSANSSDCYLPTYNVSTQSKKAIDFTAVDASIIKSTASIAGINGSFTVNIPDCANDGETACLATSFYPAFNKSNANTNKAKFHSSLTLAGIQGTMIDCASDGALGCQTVANYPAIAKDSATAQAAKLHSTITVAGVTGTMGDCAANASACFIPSYVNTSQPLKAISYDSLSAGIIKDGTTIGGILGNLIEAPANCGSDGQDSCVTTSNYPSVSKAAVTAAQGNFHSGLSIGGVSGSMNNCSADAQVDCFTVNNFPAVEKATVNSNKAKIHSTLVAGGIAGTMGDCGLDGSVGCLTVNNYPSANKNAIDSAKASFRTSLTLAGVAGTMGSCAANASGCFLPSYVNTTQPLKAISYDSIAANIVKLNTNIGGVIGSVIEAPALCGSDGATDCVTTATYPSANKNAIDSIKTKIHSTLTMASIAGQMNDCGTDGALGCFTVSDWPALNKSNFDTNKAKALSTLSSSGVSGTMAACSANSSDCYLATYNAGTQALKAINYNDITANVIKENIIIAAVTGTMIERPATCTSDGQTSCVTDASYPALNKSPIDTNKSKIHSTVTIGGVQGTMNNCGSDAQTSCFSVTNYPSFNKNTIDSGKSKIQSTLSLGGITGTMNDCAAQGSNCFVPTYAASTQAFKAINFDVIQANVIKDQITIAGVQGNVVAKPANCSSDGAVGCTAVAGFPSGDKTDITSKRALYHTSLNIGAVSGLLADCNGDNQTSCFTTADYPAVLKSNVNTNKALISPTLTIAGIQGTMADCTTLGSSCYVPSYVASTQPLKAISFDSITEGVIKNGTTIAGIAGLYPNSTYTLTPGDAHSDMNATDFNAQMKAAATVGWFDRNGTRHSHAGDSDLATAANIKSGVTIFGTAGSFVLPGAWDVRIGTVINSSTTGRLKANCRNPSNLSVWDSSEGRMADFDDATNLWTVSAHGWSDGQRVRFSYGTGSGPSDQSVYYIRDATTNQFRIATTNGGAALDYGGMTNFSVHLLDGLENHSADTVEAYVSGVTNTGMPFGSNFYCGGIDTSGSSADDGNVWKDVTTGGCNASAECRFKDQISNLEWTELQGGVFWSKAMANCESLTFDGKSDWRLPTQFEMSEAASHGIVTAASANWITAANMDQLMWTATKWSATTTNGIVTYLSNGHEGVGSYSATSQHVCVRLEGETP